MQDKALIACDCGKFACKAQLLWKGQIFTTMFRTKLLQVERFAVDLQPDSYHVKFDDHEYLLGDMVSEDHNDFNLDKTSLLHQLSIYTAIAILLEKAKVPVQAPLHLAINSPVNVFLDSNLKSNYKSLIENDQKTILITVNNKLFSFRLQNVTIAFEGMANIYERAEEYKHKNSIVVDLGGLNATFCQFRGIQPLINNMVVSNLGINVLKGRIGKVITERYGINVTADDLEQILHNGYFSHRGIVFEDSNALIESLKRDHLLQIVQFAQSRGYTFNNADILWSGGGVYLLEPYIKEEFPASKIIINPVFGNVRSYLKILEIKTNG